MPSNDDDEDWAPVFTAHTPAAEVEALADLFAKRSVTALREQLAAIGAELEWPPTARAAAEARFVEVLMQQHLRYVFKCVHRRLKAEPEGT